MGTLVLAGATSGSATLTPVDAVTAVITLPSATATLATLGANTFTAAQSVSVAGGVYLLNLTSTNNYAFAKLVGTGFGGQLDFFNGATALASVVGTTANALDIYAGTNAATKVGSFTGTGLAVTGTLAVTKASSGDICTLAVSGGPTVYTYGSGALWTVSGAGSGNGNGIFGNATQTGLQIGGTAIATASSTGLAVTGALSATNYISVASGADNVGVAGASFGYSATYGTSIVSGTGTNKDFVLWKRGGLSAVMSVSTNSTTVTFGGDVSGGTFQGTSGLYAGASGAATATIGQSSVGGGSLTHYIGNQSITTSSDFRLKENIVDTQRDALDILNKLRVVDHTWNDPSDQCENNRNARGVWTGLIAQEAVDHVRWLVNKPLVDEEEDGSKNYWQMDYGYAVPLLIKAIQQLTTRLAALEAK